MFGSAGIAFAFFSFDTNISFLSDLWIILDLDLVLFFQLSAFVQCIDASDPRKRQNSAQGRGLRRFFTPSVHSVQTKKALGNDKTLHSKRGHGHPFPLSFFVDLDWVRGALVISLFFYNISV